MMLKVLKRTSYFQLGNFKMPIIHYMFITVKTFYIP